MGKRVMKEAVAATSSASIPMKVPVKRVMKDPTKKKPAEKASKNVLSGAGAQQCKKAKPSKGGKNKPK